MEERLDEALNAKERFRKQLGEAKQEARKLKIRLTEHLDGVPVKLQKTVESRDKESDQYYDSLTAKIQKGL